MKSCLRRTVTASAGVQIFSPFPRTDPAEGPPAGLEYRFPFSWSRYPPVREGVRQRACVSLPVAASLPAAALPVAARLRQDRCMGHFCICRRAARHPPPPRGADHRSHGCASSRSPPSPFGPWTGGSSLLPAPRQHDRGGQPPPRSIGRWALPGAPALADLHLTAKSQGHPLRLDLATDFRIFQNSLISSQIASLHCPVITACENWIRTSSG